jgi:hypothetical protein
MQTRMLVLESIPDTVEERSALPVRASAHSSNARRSKAHLTEPSILRVRYMERTFSVREDLAPYVDNPPIRCKIDGAMMKGRGATALKQFNYIFMGDSELTYEADVPTPLVTLALLVSPFFLCPCVSSTPCYIYQ